MKRAKTYKATIKRVTVEHMTVEITAPSLERAAVLAEKKTTTANVRGVRILQPYDEADSEITESVSYVREIVSGNN